MKQFKTIQILSVFGMLLSLYLLFEQIFRPSFQPCSINSVVNCNAIISGAVAKTLGLPTPLYGLIGYMVILYASIVHNKKLIFYMAAFGLLFCLWIAYKELFLLHVICPICILCQLTIISIFGISIYLNKKK